MSDVNLPYWLAALTCKSISKDFSGKSKRFSFFDLDQSPFVVSTRCSRILQRMFSFNSIKPQAFFVGLGRTTNHSSSQLHNSIMFRGCLVGGFTDGSFNTPSIEWTKRFIIIISNLLIVQIVCFSLQDKREFGTISHFFRFSTNYK